MCKILVITGVKDSKKTFEFIRRMAFLMSKRNDDGIGYTAVDRAGKIFSEKWVNNDQFLDTKTVMLPEFAAKIPKDVAARLPAYALETNYYVQGKRRFDNLASITLHTRFATTGAVNILNTHPFHYKGISLIHNGGISNHATLKMNKVSACDSEAALQTYIKHNVLNNVTAAQSWLDRLEGRWAFGIIGESKTDGVIVDVVRGASFLYKAYVPDIGIVFSTDDDDIKAVCKDMKIDLTDAPKLLELHSMQRFGAVSGELIAELSLKDSKANLDKEEKNRTGYIGADGKWKPFSSYYNTNPGRTFGSAYEDDDYWNGMGGTTKTEAQKDNEQARGSSSGASEGQADKLTIRETANALAPHLAEQPEYPNVFSVDAAGNVVFDGKKVLAYVTDKKVELELRLQVWDDRFGTDTIETFDELSGAEKQQLDELEQTFTFHVLRKILLSTALMKKHGNSGGFADAVRYHTEATLKALQKAN